MLKPVVPSVAQVAIRIVCVVAALGALPRTAGAGVFNVDAFGAKPNTRVDSAPAFRDAIAAAIKAGGGEVRFGPGVYYLTSSPDKIYVAWPRNGRNLQITGVKGKTELIVTDPSLGLLRFEQCADCSLRNVICDYEVPPFTQGAIVAIDNGAATFDLKLDAGYPPLDAPFFDKGREWGLPIDAKERLPKACWLDHVRLRDWQKQPDGAWRLSCQLKSNIKELAAGDRFVVVSRSKGPTVLAVWSSSRITTEDVVIYASPGITDGVVLSDAATFRRFQVRFREGSSRLVTSNGDGIHVHGNRRGPIIEDCYFEGICDDGINLNTHMNPVARVDSPTQIVVARGPVTFARGDRVQIVDPATGTIKGTTTVVDEKPLANDLHALKLKDSVPQIKANEGLTAGEGQRHGDDAERITGDIVYNLGCANANYVIRNNTFVRHRRHGLLIRSGGGIIEGNTFNMLGGQGMVIENDGSIEGPMADDITIRNNKLTAVGRCRYYGANIQDGAITVRTNDIKSHLATGRAIGNIRILNNQIDEPPRYGLFIGSARGVTVADTRITATAGATVFDKSAAVCVENAAGIEVSKLAFTDPRACVEAGVLVRKSVDPGDKGFVLKDASLKLPAGIPEVADLRGRE